MTGPRRAAAATVVALLVCGCASTFEDDSSLVEDGTVPAESAPGTRPVGTVPATARGVLDEMASTAQGLSVQIGDDGDEDATFARIEELWLTIEPELIVDDPALANGVQAAVDLARTAVLRNRPGDANKAASLLSNLATDHAS